jgi:protocatechuate 3,4-dioxygenase beta subunit
MGYAQLSRREAITGLGLATFFRPFAARAQSDRCVLTPDSGEGPFYFDPSLVRSDIVDGHAGAPLALEIEVVSVDGCRVLTDARVDIWHADGLGLYSGYSDQPGVGAGMPVDIRSQSFLRGTQFSDNDGRVDFRTIYPSWYGGRTPHVHFKVFVSARELVAGQIFFPDEINDEVFADWDPYREFRRRRTAFNDNDMFLVDGALQGAMAAVERTNDGYRAGVTLAVAPR